MCVHTAGYDDMTICAPYEQQRRYYAMDGMQVISAYYDQSGSLVMGPRTGTPMRLVSPAPPVLVPPGAAGPRAPQAPPMYPPQPQTAQQNVYSAQNGSNVGGMYIVFKETSLSGGVYVIVFFFLDFICNVHFIILFFACLLSLYLS